MNASFLDAGAVNTWHMAVTSKQSKMKSRKQKVSIVLLFIVAMLPNAFMPTWLDENTPRLPLRFRV